MTLSLAVDIAVAMALVWAHAWSPPLGLWLILGLVAVSGAGRALGGARPMSAVTVLTGKAGVAVAVALALMLLVREVVRAALPPERTRRLVRRLDPAAVPLVALFAAALVLRFVTGG